MEFVIVKNLKNKSDPIYGFGYVPYIYEIAKYPVTNEEYADFLNSVAKFHDPYLLYDPNLTTGLFGGIDCITQSNSRIYQPKKNWERRPVVYISWYDLARMTNWLHYGKPCTGSSELGTTEGTNSIGAYDTRYFPKAGVDSVAYNKLPLTRNPNALYWIPSEDEWYKAAYHDPTIDNQRQYWNYPTRTDQTPNNYSPPGDQHSVNFFRDVFSVGKPYFLTEVDAYQFASSYYGTYDQGGNVWEWLENWRLVDRGNEPVRGLRGGSATYTEIGVHAANTDPGNPSHKKFVWGGRIAKAHVTHDNIVIYSDSSYITRCWNTRKFKLRLKKMFMTLRKSSRVTHD